MLAIGPFHSHPAMVGDEEGSKVRPTFGASQRRSHQPRIECDRLRQSATGPRRDHPRAGAKAHREQQPAPADAPESS
jgi:hypothetical protein